MPTAGRLGRLLSRIGLALLASSLASPSSAQVAGSAGTSRAVGPFARFDLPDEWEARFWGDAGTKALLAMEPKAVADLVPVQAGLRHCRCPSCLPVSDQDTLRWSPEAPTVVTCRLCGAKVPDDAFPAKVPPAPGQPPAIPEDVVEVRPRVVHRYPYHVVDPLKQAYPEEHLYLAAKRDYEARESLARVALYAAVRHHEQPPGSRDPALARLAAVLILRFAQVYPSYATHYDQPDEPKFLQPADLKPPYRRGYRTGKWDWSGCLDVPMNLLIAYALIRDDPALAEAGRLLGEANPARTIETDLFRASAEFVRLQPEEYSEASLYAYRGLLAVGRLLDEPTLVREALTRLDGFAERGFYHDGLWRQGDPSAHRRVVGLIDGWIGRLLAGYDAPTLTHEDAGWAPGSGAQPIMALARQAGAAILDDRPAPDVQQVTWPAPRAEDNSRLPMLLGGAGLARLAVGQGADALDVELRGLGDFGSGHSHRLTLRLAVAGRTILGDLDDQPPSERGFERATVGHNAVLVDGLNQRESLEESRRPAPGSEVLFFAADPDFQVVTFEDRFAYPTSSTRYRQTVVACAGARTRFAVSVFEVAGGLQHDQLYHGAAGSVARWRISARTAPGPASLLPPGIPFVANAEADDGRWFVQSFGELTGLSSGRLDRPAQALLTLGTSPGVRLHLLGDTPTWAVVGVTPDPTASGSSEILEPPGRPALVLRRRSDDGSTLRSTFVTVFEPVGAGEGLRRVGRVHTPPGTVALALEADEGPEHLVVNLRAGTPCEVELVDGRRLRTDGLAVRVTPSCLLLAGGTFAELEGRRLQQARVAGTIKATGRTGRDGAAARGWFETVEPLEAPESLAGRTLIVGHGDGTRRGWTIHAARNRPSGGALIEVREVPGFRLDPATDEAVRYMFPRGRAPGPHVFKVDRIARSDATPHEPRDLRAAVREGTRTSIFDDEPEIP